MQSLPPHEVFNSKSVLKKILDVITIDKESEKNLYEIDIKASDVLIADTRQIKTYFEQIYKKEI